MSTPTRKKSKTRFYAFVASVFLHIIILVCFAVVKISHGVLPTSTPDKVHFATLGQIRYIAQSQSVMHKPKVRKKSSTATFADDKITDTNVGQIFNSADNALSPDIFEKAEALPNIADEAEQPQSSPVDFFGSKSYERSICYVVDCSGSMKGLFGQVRQNLKQSISDLQADQYFYVIFFGDGQVFELASGQMVRAGNSAKSNAFKFIDSIDSKGKTNALEALKIAVKLRDHCQKCPGVIYFLTDGFELAEENSDQFTNETTGLLEQFAPDTKVNTIGFWVQPGDGEILNVIAEKTGGSSILINGSAEK